MMPTRNFIGFWFIRRIAKNNFQSGAPVADPARRWCCLNRAGSEIGAPLGQWIQPMLWSLHWTNHGEIPQKKSTCEMGP